MIIISDGKYFRLFIIALLIPIIGVFGQKPYSLSSLTDSALRNLPLLMEKKALINSGQSAVKDIRHQFIPFLRANAQVDMGTDNSLPGSYYSFGIIPSTSSGISSQNNGQTALGSLATLYGAYTFLDFGYRKASIQSAISNVGVETADYERLSYQVKSDVTRLYLTMLKKQMQLEIESQNRQRYERIFSVIHALTMSGIKPGVDSSLALAELSKSITAYTQVLGSVNDLREQLSYYTGIPSFRLQIDALSLKDRDSAQTILSDTSGMESNPLISYYTSVNNAYASDERRISKSFQPTVSLVATTWTRASSITPELDYKSLGTGLGVQRYNYLAGISLQYDLFNGIHKKDRLEIIHFQQQAGEYQLHQQELALQSASNQADLAIHTAELNLLELPVQINAAKDTYNQKLAQYKAGIISLIDLTNAAFVLYRSQNDYTETLTDWYLAHLDKAFAVGGLDHFIQIIK
ncbi:MAG TPA: TolC family protein [Puia sp.]|jgi:outer membrane protein TolC|nr:TolC family protein [Puia sp.]